MTSITLPTSRSFNRVFQIALGVLLTLGCVGRYQVPPLVDRSLSRADERAAQEAYDRGLALAGAGDFSSALVEFTRVVEQYPASRQSALALYWQGRSFYQTGDDLAAETALSRYLDLSPRVPNRDHAIALLASAMYGQGRFETALATALRVENAPAQRLPVFLHLAENLAQRLPRSVVTDVARDEPERNWLAPLYLQAARWAYAAGDIAAAAAMAGPVVAFSGLPPAMIAEARTLTGGGASNAPPRIGLIAPAEGRFATVTEQIERGVTIALEEVNASRATGFELVSRATASNADSTIGVIRKLARGDRVQVVLGPLTSEFAIPAGDVAREEGIVLVSPTATDARLLDMGPTVFTVNALDGALGHTIGTYATRRLGLSRVAVLAPDDAYGRIQSEAFVAAIEAEGARVVFRGTYDVGATQFTDLIGDVVRAQADAVFLATNRPNEALRILNQLAFFELDDVIPLGTDAWNDESFTGQGAQFARGYFADTFSRDPRITRWDDFVRRYEARYGEAPTNRIAAWGYDATRLAVERLLPGGGSGGSDYRGASALYRMASGSPVRTVVIHRMDRDGPVAVDW